MPGFVYVCGCACIHALVRLWIGYRISECAFYGSYKRSVTVMCHFRSGF